MPGLLFDKINYVKQSKSGFTLIEVLIALALIALVSVVAIPNFKKYSASQDIYTAATNVVNVLRRAHSNAIAGIRCPNDFNVTFQSGDKWVQPTPSYSYDVQFSSSNITLTTECVNTSSGEIDFSASPTPAPNSSFSGTQNYLDTGNISPSQKTTLGSTTYNSTCTNGMGWISFRTNQAYYSCNNPMGNPANYVSISSISPYYMVLHDGRNISSDVVIEIDTSGNISEITD